MMLFIHLLPGLLVLVIGYMMLLWPPKRINWFYGFRTKYSMRNRQTWRKGNLYYTKMIMGTGLMSIAIALACYYLLPFPVSLIIVVGFMIVMFMLSIQLTNDYLKRKFEEKYEEK